MRRILLTAPANFARHPLRSLSELAKRLLLILLITLIASFFGAPKAQANPTPFQNGDVFASVGNGQVKRFNSAGTLIDTLDTTTNSTATAGTCFDAVGNFYVTDFNAQKVSKFNKMGALVAASFGSGYNADPESCVVDTSGNIFVGQADGSHQILKFGSSGNLIASYAPAIESRGTDWITPTSDQCTMFYTSEGGSVKRFNVCTNTQLADFASGLSGPCYALRIRANSEVLVACTSQVYRLSSSGAVLQTYLRSAYTESGTLFALNLDPDGTSFWTGGLESGNVYKIDIASGNKLLSFNTGTSLLGGLAIFGEATPPLFYRVMLPLILKR